MGEHEHCLLSITDRQFTIPCEKKKNAPPALPTTPGPPHHLLSLLLQLLVLLLQLHLLLLFPSFSSYRSSSRSTYDINTYGMRLVKLPPTFRCKLASFRRALSLLYDDCFRQLVFSTGRFGPCGANDVKYFPISWQPSTQPPIEGSHPPPPRIPPARVTEFC